MCVVEDYRFSFERLRVWQQAREGVVEVFRLTADFPKTETYNLVSQLNRAAVSVVANLAEGSGRFTGKDPARFSSLAYGSLMETACLQTLARDLGFPAAEDYQLQREQVSEISNPINTLRSKQSQS